MSKRSPPPPPPQRRHRPLLDHDVDTATASEIREIRVKRWQQPPTRNKKRKAMDDGGDVDNDGWYKVFYTVFIQHYNKTHQC